METIKLLWDKIKATPLDKIIGYILLTPPIIGVWKFLVNPVYYVGGSLLGFEYNSVWTGVLNSGDGGSGSYTSALPFYLGFMALAGAYLIKDKN